MEKPKNNAQLTALLNTVGSKLGMSPEQLRKELEAGKFDRALAGMDEKSAAKFRQVLADPKKLDQIMSSRQAKALYEKLTG
ncbi:MAG: hypothetical protein J5722_06530 [Oscillospiraceae bacterium]|nr:hypothetical protein [Oscillospiraceae bacterium]